MGAIVFGADAMLNQMAGPILITVAAADVVVCQRTGPHNLCAGIVIIGMFHSHFAVFQNVAHQRFAQFVRQVYIFGVGEITLDDVRKDIGHAASGLIGRQGHGQFRVHDGEYRTNHFGAQIALNAFVGDNRAVGAFGACRSQRQNAGYRHCFFHFFIANVEIFPSIAVIVYANGNALGRICHAAAADSQQHIYIFLFYDFHTL